MTNGRFPPWLKRLDGIRPVLERLGTLEEQEDEYIEAKVITVTNEEDLVFGDIASAEIVRIGFEYEPTSDEDFILGAVFTYEGDNDAFVISGDELRNPFGTPLAIFQGMQYPIPIPSTAYSESWDLVITALAADDGVEKTGTLRIWDRIDHADSNNPTRLLKEISLSKTYIAP